MRAPDAEWAKLTIRYADIYDEILETVASAEPELSASTVARRIEADKELHSLRATYRADAERLLAKSRAAAFMLKDLPRRGRSTDDASMTE